MRDKKDCKIVQDLLPNYIEVLTNEETNLFIEEHLKSCDECKKIYDNMQLKLSREKEKISKDEVDYLKKYNNKLKILRILIIAIIVVIMFVFVGIVARKMLIIADMNNKINQYTNATNYYKKINQYGEDTLISTEYYQKNEKYISTTREFTIQQGLYQTIINYCADGKKINTYVESNDTKSVILDSGGILKLQFIDWYETFCINNIGDLLKIAALSSISTEICNQKECYKITRKYSDLGDNYYEVIYIEKETGLAIRYTSPAEMNGYKGDTIIEYQYSFNAVTDEDLKEPDVTEYKIIQNISE